MKLFLQKKCIIFERWGSAPRPPCLRRLGAGGFAPEPPASGGWGFRPQTPIGIRRLGAPPQNPKTASPLRISGYAPAWVHKIIHWVIILCSGSQCRRYDEAKGAVPHERLLVPPPILVHSECFFGASRNDKTTGNNGKRKNNFQTWFSFEVFSIVCKIAGHQLLYMNVTQ